MKSRFDKARWNRLSPVLDELLALDASAQGARLERLRRADPALADDLAGLLEQRGPIEREAFLEGPLLRPMPERTLEGQVIGSYTLERLLGQGGMGSVWLARRSDGRYDASVAIKLLNPALLGPGGVERFRREGRALGRLAHPHIARLIDAGVTQTGQPYLVLEYVEGETIHRWCETRSLDTAARVRLFLDVLAAVEHAHAKLILHRDLKPSNILVTADGQVKLVDFGIAKLLDDGTEAAPLAGLTQMAGQAFTPDYAAPEQVQGGEVSGATDVYALGVLLYVLLTECHPTTVARHTPLDRLRAVVETQPARPSETGRSFANDERLRADKRSSQRARALRGDLDNILLKALKKLPAERYATVAAFADDLRRYLSHQPIGARPDSLSYRAAKFVMRNKLVVGAGAIVLVTVIIAAAISVRQAVEATHQRDRALSLAARNEAVIDFVSDMLTEVAPAEQPIRVADLLDRSQAMLIREETLPEHRAAILSVLSGYYLSAGKPGQAQVLLSRSLELTRSSEDRELRSVLLCDSAFAASLIGRPADAGKLIEQGLALSRAYPMATVRCLRSRGYIAQNTNDPQTALDYALRAQARLRELPVAKPEVEADLLADIGGAHALAGRSAEAERFYTAAMTKLVKLGRGESPGVFFLRNNLGVLRFGAGDSLHALEQYDEALRIAVHRSAGGEPPPYLLFNRAVTLSTLARYPEALKAFDVTIDSATRTSNVNIRIGALVGRAYTLARAGEIARAESELASVAPEIGRTVAPDSVPATTFLQVQAFIDSERGRIPEALADLEKIFDFFEARHMAVAPVVRGLQLRADLYLRKGNTAAAMADAQRALEISQRLQGDRPYSSLTGLSLMLMSRLHESSGQYELARRFAAQAVAHLRETLGAEHADTLRAMRAAQPAD